LKRKSQISITKNNTGRKSRIVEILEENWPESSILIFERNAENVEKVEKSETILDFQGIDRSNYLQL
jgi:hypothetical protein